jgi:tyrosine-protein phosphatase YwqE
MQTNGYRPVLAHPARYSFWHTKYERYRQLYEKGVILQINIGSIIGAYGPGVKRTVENLIDDGMVRLIGSDCHNMGHVPMLQAAFQEPYLHKLVDQGMLLNDQL